MFISKQIKLSNIQSNAVVLFQLYKGLVKWTSRTKEGDKKEIKKIILLYSFSVKDLFNRYRRLNLRKHSRRKEGLFFSFSIILIF